MSDIQKIKKLKLTLMLADLPTGCASVAIHEKNSLRTLITTRFYMVDSSKKLPDLGDLEAIVSKLFQEELNFFKPTMLEFYCANLGTPPVIMNNDQELQKIYNFFKFSPVDMLDVLIVNNPQKPALSQRIRDDISEFTRILDDADLNSTLELNQTIKTEVGNSATLSFDNISQIEPAKEKENKKDNSFCDFGFKVIPQSRKRIPSPSKFRVVRIKNRKKKNEKKKQRKKKIMEKKYFNDFLLLE